MHKRDECTGLVRFKVTGGYAYRDGLRDRGFQFDRLRQFWWLEVPVADAAEVKGVEEFLKAADKIDTTNARWRALGQ